MRATLWVCCLCATAPLAQAAQVVKTAAGPIAGVPTTDGSVIVFKGIPYAAPPIGRLRWRPPQPVPHWHQVRKADHFGAPCMQGPNTPLGPWTAEFMYVTPPSEDCLYLNIWTRSLAPANQPVLVFIHGGAFSSGSGDVPVYDGEALARSGLMVVTINYRLGALGFLAHPELTAESPQHSSGNYGLLDQMAAIRWVKENIRAFGGDPRRIAIAGQSAGAMSVAALLASDLAKGLFTSAIADSGIGGRDITPKTRPQAEQDGVAFAKTKGAANLAALRALPAKDFVPGPGEALRFGPVVDGWVLTEAPNVRTTERGDNDVPVVTGFQANDWLLGGGAANSLAEYRERAHKRYGAMAEEFLKLYPASTDAQAKAADIESAQERLRSGAYLWATHRSETHRSPAFVYYFDRAIPWPAHPEFGAFHTGEIPYAFGTLDKLQRPWTPVDRALSQEMMTYWREMAAHGDPNGGNEPKWRPVQTAKPEVMRLGEHSGPMPVAVDGRIDLWRRSFAAEESKKAPLF